MAKMGKDFDVVEKILNQYFKEKQKSFTEIKEEMLHHQSEQLQKSVEILDKE